MADWSSLLGQTLDAAIIEAGNYGFKIRVNKWNNSDGIGTADHRENRINVDCVRHPPETPDWIVGKINGVG